MIAQENDMTTFASLGVPEVLAAALAKRGITVPTEIQTALIPAAYAGENLIGEAPTGGLIQLFCVDVSKHAALTNAYRCKHLVGVGHKTNLQS